MNFETYQKGYRDAIVAVDNKLKESIARNEGALTTKHTVNVINDVIVHVHNELSATNLQEHEEEKTFHEFIVEIIKQERGL